MIYPLHSQFRHGGPTPIITPGGEMGCTCYAESRGARCRRWVACRRVPKTPPDTPTPIAGPGTLRQIWESLKFGADILDDERWQQAFEDA